MSGGNAGTPVCDHKAKSKLTKLPEAQHGRASSDLKTRRVGILPYVDTVEITLRERHVPECFTNRWNRENSHMGSICIRPPQYGVLDRRLPLPPVCTTICPCQERKEQEMRVNTTGSKSRGGGNQPHAGWERGIMYFHRAWYDEMSHHQEHGRFTASSSRGEVDKGSQTDGIPFLWCCDVLFGAPYAQYPSLVPT